MEVLRSGRLSDRRGARASPTKGMDWEPIALRGELSDPAYCTIQARPGAEPGKHNEGMDMQGFLKEFRDFAVKGNMIDLAIGVIIGAAFGAIVSSIVDDIFMPIIGLIIGGIDFSNLFIVLSNPNDVPVPSVAAANEAGVATLNIGLFINALVKFLIIAFVLFLMVKGINSMKREAAKDPAPAAPNKEEVLLTEIRDAIKAQAPAQVEPAAAAAERLSEAPAPAKAPARRSSTGKPATNKPVGR